VNCERFHLPILTRTRSKAVKKLVCRALGYPVPSSFRKTQPRFIGRNFDTYVQKSDNVQIWNEEVSLERRYVIVGLDEKNTISRVRVVNGEELARFDTTGTLTRKYQATLEPGEGNAELFTDTDTALLIPHVCAGAPLRNQANPVDAPEHGSILPIGEIYRLLSNAIGRSFPDAGRDQDRNRGAELHRIACELLGYDVYRDDGRFPDIRNQLLEVKLQTSRTIDLGLVRPDSEEPLEVLRIADTPLRPCDVRFALFHAQEDEGEITLTQLYLTTGERFFYRFPQLGRNGENSKLQIHLPRGFFDR